MKFFPMLPDVKGNVTCPGICSFPHAIVVRFCTHGDSKGSRRRPAAMSYGISGANSHGVPKARCHGEWFHARSRYDESACAAVRVAIHRTECNQDSAIDKWCTAFLSLDGDSLPRMSRVSAKRAAILPLRRKVVATVLAIMLACVAIGPQARATPALVGLRARNASRLPRQDGSRRRAAWCQRRLPDGHAQGPKPGG